MRLHSLEKDPTITDKICENIQLGLSYKLCANIAGISDAAFFMWMRNARDIIEKCQHLDDGEMELDRSQRLELEFFKRVKEAEAICARNSLIKINAAGMEQWQAAAWLLERRYPEDYGRREVMTHDGSVTINDTPRDKLMAKIMEITKRREANEAELDANREGE